MINEIKLTDKRVLVTGGGTGLGLGIAKELADAGAEVIIAGRRESILEKVSSEFGFRYAVLDIADHDSIPNWVKSVEERFGPLDGLVNNAGVQNNRPALEFTKEELEALFAINVTGTYVLTREVAKSMTQRKKGSIVFITSSAVHMGLTNNLIYSGSKGALSSIARAFASELSPLGIRVNSVAPGWIETELLKESMRRVPERRDMVMRRSMLGRFGTEKDVGMAVTFLISDAAAFITAAELRVDGGISVSL